MHEQRIEYIRVSTLDQHTERQLDGIEVDKTFTPGDRSLNSSNSNEVLHWSMTEEALLGSPSSR